MVDRSTLLKSGSNTCALRPPRLQTDALPWPSLLVTATLPTTSTRTEQRIGFPFLLVNSSAVLIGASDIGRTEDVQLLLAVPGINVNYTVQDGLTALLLASDRGHTAIVRMLLDVQGIDVNRASIRGNRTALMSAIFNGHTSIVRLLLAALL